MKKIVNTLLVSTMVLSIGVNVAQATEGDNVVKDSSIIETLETTEDTQDITLVEDEEVEETQETSVIEQEKGTDIAEEKEVKKENKKVEDKKIKEDRQYSNVKTEKSTGVVDLKYVKNDTNSYLNNEYFKYSLNKEDNTLSINIGESIETFTFSEQIDDDNFRYDINLNVKEEDRVSSQASISIGNILVNTKENTVKLDDSWGYLKVSKGIRENKALTPVATIPLGMYDDSVATIFKNVETSELVIDLRYKDESFKTDTLLEQQDLYTFKNDSNRILVKTVAENGYESLRDVTKREVIKRENSENVSLEMLKEDFGWHEVSENMFKDAEYQSKALAYDTDSVFNHIKKVANNHFYPKIEDMTYIVSNEDEASTLAYQFNEKGDINFKINSLDEKATNQQNNYLITFKIDDTLKNSEAYKLNLGKIVEQDLLVDFGEWGTGAVHTITEFKEDEITVKVSRYTVSGVSKGYDLYAIDFEIDTLNAPPVEPVEPPKEDEEKPVEPKKEVKKVVKEEPKKLPKAGNEISQTLAISTILSTLASGLYFFKRK